MFKGPTTTTTCPPCRFLAEMPEATKSDCEFLSAERFAILQTALND